MKYEALSDQNELGCDHVTNLFSAVIGTLILCLLGIFFMLFCHLLAFFSKLTFLKKNLEGTLSQYQIA